MAASTGEASRWLDADAASRARGDEFWSYVSPACQSEATKAAPGRASAIRVGRGVECVQDAGLREASPDSGWDSQDLLGLREEWDGSCDPVQWGCSSQRQTRAIRGSAQGDSGLYAAYQEEKASHPEAVVVYVFIAMFIATLIISLAQIWR